MKYPEWQENELADTLMFALQDGQWHTRQQLREKTGLPLRLLRAAREACKGKVIYGQKGQRLTEQATEHEINACVVEMNTMARTLMKQANHLQTILWNKVTQK